MPLCEVCGQPAIMAVQDIKEVVNDTDKKWMYFEPEGSVHYLCKQHERQSVKTLLPGHGDMLSQMSFWEVAAEVLGKAYLRDKEKRDD